MEAKELLESLKLVLRRHPYPSIAIAVTVFQSTQVGPLLVVASLDAWNQPLDSIAALGVYLQ